MNHRSVYRTKAGIGCFGGLVVQALAFYLIYVGTPWTTRQYQDPAMGSVRTEIVVQRTFAYYLGGILLCVGVLVINWALHCYLKSKERTTVWDRLLSFLRGDQPEGRGAKSPNGMMTTGCMTKCANCGAPNPPNRTNCYRCQSGLPHEDYS